MNLKVHKLERIIAEQLGYDFDDLIADKAEYRKYNGYKNGVPRDINEPRQNDFRQAAIAVLHELKLIDPRDIADHG